MQESEKNQTSVPETTPDSRPQGKESPKPEKRPLSIWRRMFRILLVMLIIFGLGAILVIFTLYRPLRERLFRAETRIEELTDRSASEINSAKEEINRLSSIEDKFGDTQAELDELVLHNLILKIRLDLMSAKLALVSDDPQEASQALHETADRIADLKKLAGSQQQKNVENLETRLELVLTEIDEETFAAISDLDVMLDILEELET
ncbi:MAG: hypothetical protein A2Z16_08810 [Chloroflexi bacterium RBG_16_54_18]|nr:MAG: hypothetical protein A2Z16_08810 [Chloroflexi bacterium RBG_16_54_18]